MNVVNLDLSVGSRLPVACTALGRAILAFSDADEVEKLVNRIELVRHTPYTITDKTEFMAELARTRERGYAINTEELSLGLETLAAPIFNGSRVEAAYGASYPISRFGDEAQRGPLAAESAANILGHIAQAIELHWSF